MVNEEVKKKVRERFDKAKKPMIKPSHRGLFTEKAKKHGMTAQEFASYVLSHKDNFDATTIKEANFAKNFGGKKKHG